MQLSSESACAQPERRRVRRHSFDVGLEIEWGSATLRGRVRDISLEGMLIELPDPLWIGARFSAQVKLEPPLWVECVVRRVEPGRGMGVSFSLPQEADRPRLAALLEALEKKHR